MNVPPGLISTIWSFMAVWLAWKSIEWLISVLFVRWTRTVSPRWTRMVGPGTVPPNVQAFTTNPSATVMSLSMIGMSMSWTVPVRTRGAAGSRRSYLGAVGSATGAPAAADGAAGAAVAAGLTAGSPMAMPSPTAIVPVMPAAAWPGIEQRNVMPPAGTVTVPDTVLPASAVSLVPSAKV